MRRTSVTSGKLMSQHALEAVNLDAESGNVKMNHVDTWKLKRKEFEKMVQLEFEKHRNCSDTYWTQRRHPTTSDGCSEAITKENR